MKTADNNLISADLLADLEYAARLVAEGRQDAEFARRIHADAEKIRDEVFRKNGLLDIGVPAIRSLRDGE
jgi:hypothetical protein